MLAKIKAASRQLEETHKSSSNSIGELSQIHEAFEKQLQSLQAAEAALVSGPGAVAIAGDVATLKQRDAEVSARLAAAAETTAKAEEALKAAAGDAGARASLEQQLAALDDELDKATAKRDELQAKLDGIQRAHGAAIKVTGAVELAVKTQNESLMKEKKARCPRAAPACAARFARSHPFHAHPPAPTRFFPPAGAARGDGRGDEGQGGGRGGDGRGRAREGVGGGGRGAGAQGARRAGGAARQVQAARGRGGEEARGREGGPRAGAGPRHEGGCQGARARARARERERRARERKRARASRLTLATARAAPRPALAHAPFLPQIKALEERHAKIKDLKEKGLQADNEATRLAGSIAGSKTKLLELAPKLAQSKALAHILAACIAAQDEAEQGAAALADRVRASKAEVAALPDIILEVGEHAAGALATAKLEPAKNPCVSARVEARARARKRARESERAGASASASASASGRHGGCADVRARPPHRTGLAALPPSAPAPAPAQGLRDRRQAQEGRGEPRQVRARARLRAARRGGRGRGRRQGR